VRLAPLLLRLRLLEKHAGEEEEGGDAAVLAASPSEFLGSPSELLPSPSELWEPPSELLGSPSELWEPPSELLGPPSELWEPPSELLGPPSELLASPSELLGPPSELLASPSELLASPSELLGGLTATELSVSHASAAACFRDAQRREDLFATEAVRPQRLGWTAAGQLRLEPDCAVARLLNQVQVNSRTHVYQLNR
jgi:hypothetical protein